MGWGGGGLAGFQSGETKSPAYFRSVCGRSYSFPLAVVLYSCWNCPSALYSLWMVAALGPNLGSKQKHGLAHLTLLCSQIRWPCHPVSSVIYFWLLKPRDEVKKQWLFLCCNSSLWVNGSHSSADNTAFILSSSSQIPPLFLFPYQLTWDTYPLSLLSGMKSRCTFVWELSWEVGTSPKVQFKPLSLSAPPWNRLLSLSLMNFPSSSMSQLTNPWICLLFFTHSKGGRKLINQKSQINKK